MAYFVVRSRYLSQLDDVRLAARPAHRAWLARLRDDGRLVNAGPLADGSGALLVFVAANEAELAELLAEDPYPSASLTAEVVGQWQPLFEW